jgi:hypothetical protein
MKKISLQALFLAFALWMLPQPARSAGKPADGGANTSACRNLPHSNHPEAELSNGLLDAVVFLPDAKSGYYRSSRFDWSGVVGCVSYKAHNFFGEWFPRYDPLVHDSITGPVEEFQLDDGSSGYGTAQPNGLFVKIGVGVLRKLGNSPYSSFVSYPIVDGGKWTVRRKRRSVTFVQKLRSPLGIAYTYEKTLTLEKNQPVLTLEHRLKNEGAKPIVTNVYDHDFYMLDGRATGPGITVTFPFELKAEGTIGNAAEIEGKQVIYHREIQNKESYATVLKGYSESSAGYDFTIEDQNAKIGVEQSSDKPVARIYLWSIRTTVCPEAFIHLDIPPGKTAQWKIHYRFFVNAK